MKPETKEATLGSVAKWQAIFDGTGRDDFGDNCPLCQRFNDSMMDGPDIIECVTVDGERCPVMLRSGQDECRGTPYVEWCRLIGDSPRIADTPERKAAAQAELDFLKSLLPEAE